MSSGTWIVEFKSRGCSCALNVNFLWALRNIYISDNHLCAAWCWVQNQISEMKHSILHIDAHYDTVGHCACPVNNISELRKINFYEYKRLRHPNDHDCSAFRWDNYLSIYQHLNAGLIEEIRFATHKLGEEPNFSVLHIEPTDLINNIESIPEGGNWIINLDFDFFYDKDQPRITTVDQAKLLSALKNLHDKSNKSIVTVALSPECCGSWKTAENVLVEFSSVFGFPPFLPTL